MADGVRGLRPSWDDRLCGLGELGEALVGFEFRFGGGRVAGWEKGLEGGRGEVAGETGAVGGGEGFGGGGGHAGPCGAPIVVGCGLEGGDVFGESGGAAERIR